MGLRVAPRTEVGIFGLLAPNSKELLHIKGLHVGPSAGYVGVVLNRLPNEAHLGLLGSLCVMFGWEPTLSSVGVYV